MDKKANESKLGPRLASELSQLLELASSQWESIAFDMSGISNLVDILPNMTLEDSDSRHGQLAVVQQFE